MTDRTCSLIDDQTFITAVKGLCSRLEIPDYRMLLAVMQFESCLNPQAVQPQTKATGLIQFMPNTAAGLNTTCGYLYGMTALQQLEYVEKYLRPFHGHLDKISDLYMSVLWPAAVGKPEDHELWSKTHHAACYRVNPLDWNHDGRITKGEAAKRVADIYVSMCESLPPYD